MSESVGPGIGNRPLLTVLAHFSPSAGERRGGAILTTFVAGDVIAERFEILRFLGQGGMGQVFEALDRELGIAVALKVVRPDLATRDDVVPRFRSEVQLARQVTHPNVCRIYDLVQHRSTSLRSWGGQGRHLLIVTMERLRGETLGQRLKRAAPFSQAEALPLIAQMAAALDAAHEVGVVHRDFKSANVMLVEGDRSAARRAVVTDFGLAVPLRVTRHDPAASPLPLGNAHAAVSGTPAYVAPELIAGQEPAAAADVYSFGVVLYEMMTGLLPFRSESPEKTARLRLEADPEPPSRHRPELSPAWDAAILRCLSRDPERRFARAGDVVEALTSDADPPRQARPTGKALAAAAALAVLASLLAFGQPALREARPSVAFLGMAQISGPSDAEWISTALTEILTSALTSVGPGGLRAVAREDVASWRERSRTTAGRLTPEDLRRAHDQLDADYLVYGLYMARSDRNMQLDVRLWNGATGRSLASALETGRQDEAAELATRIGERFRSRLGLDQTLAEAPAAPRLHAAQAEAWASAGHVARAAAEARRAFELAADLPWDERLRIEGLYRRTLYDWPRARKVYRALCKIFPDNLDDALGLAAVETASGRPLAALATLDDLRRRMPAVTDPRLDLAEAWAARAHGDRERQRQAAARAAAAAEAQGAELSAVQARLLEGEALDDLGATDEARALETRLRKVLAARGDRLLLARAGDTWTTADFGLALPEARELFRRAGDRPGEARTLIRQAFGAQEDVPGAEEKLRRALQAALATHDRQVEAEALNRLAILAYMRNDQHQTLELFREAVQVARASGNLRLLAGILGNYAGLLVALADLATAQEAFDEAIRLARQVGSRRVLFLALMKSSWTLSQRGETAEAEARLLEAERVARAYGDKSLVATAAGALGSFYANVNLAKARRWLEASLELGSPRTEDALGSELGLVRVAIDEARYEEAEAKLQQVRSAYSSAEGFKHFQDQIRLDQALLLVERRQFQEARKVLHLIPDAQQAVMLRHMIWRTKARVEAVLGDTLQARAKVGALVAEARASGDVLLELEDRIALGQIALDSGDVAAGRTELDGVARRARSLGLLVIADRAERVASR